MNTKRVALLVIVGGACLALRTFAASGGFDRYKFGIGTDLTLLGLVMVFLVVAARMEGSKKRSDTEKPDYRQRMKIIIKMCVVWVVVVGFIIYFWSLFGPKP